MTVPAVMGWGGVASLSWSNVPGSILTMALEKAPAQDKAEYGSRLKLYAARRPFRQ